jgi:hypothetical protein
MSEPEDLETPQKSLNGSVLSTGGELASPPKSQRLPEASVQLEALSRAPGIGANCLS